MTEHGPPVCEVVMWKRPLLALLLLGSGTLVWYYCGPLQRYALSLFSDVLLTFVCSLGLLGVLSRHFSINQLLACHVFLYGLWQQRVLLYSKGLEVGMSLSEHLSFTKYSPPPEVEATKDAIISIPVDPLDWQVSQVVANDIAACLANTIGAAEGVLRVAASGSDSKLFSKVVAVLYIVSAVGRAASGATVAYIVLWFMFLVPLGISKLSPEGSSNTPTFLQKKSTVLGSCTPGDSPRSTFSSPHRMKFFS